MTQEEIIAQYNELVAADKLDVATKLRALVDEVTAKTNTLYASGMPPIYSALIANLGHIANTLDPSVNTPPGLPLP